MLVGLRSIVRDRTVIGDMTLRPHSRDVFPSPARDGRTVESRIRGGRGRLCRDDPPGQG